MSPKIQEIGAQRFRHALANSWEERASFCEPVMTYRDRTGWWGHETRTTKSIRTEIRLSCRENLPDLAESMFRNGSSVSCAFASLQLRQALGKSCPAEGPN